MDGTVRRAPAEATGDVAGRGRLSGRRILVVGAGQQGYGIDDGPIGNGRALSVLCGREGGAVAAADIDRHGVAETARHLESEGSQVVTMVGDAADERDVESMVAQSVADLGGLDGLVLNVGVPCGAGFEGTSVEEWDRSFAINVRSHFLGCKHALPVLPPGGSVVLISSVAALLPVNDIPAYHASKAALAGLCHYAAAKGAPRGIRVNIVVPGLIDTSLGRLATSFEPERADKPIPLGRQGTAWEVAYAAVFLLSDEASYITGQSLIVDGGYAALR